MTAWKAAILFLIVLLPGSASAQVLSEQQLDYLRQQFLEAIFNTVDGSYLAVNSIPFNRIQGNIPASKITEADPIAGSIASSALSSANVAQSTANSAQNTANSALSSANSAQDTANSAASGVSSLDPRVTVLELSAPIWNQASVDASSWTSSIPYATVFSTNLTFELVGSTVTLYIANGIITNAVKE